MKSLKSRGFVIAVTLMFALTASGCGTLMHPERRTATLSHRIDGTSLVLDCLWLFVGVVPGVVALGVDFLGGTIYYSEQELQARAGDKVSVNLRGKAPADSIVTLRLLDRDGRDLAVSAQARSSKGSELGGPLTLTIPEGTEVSDAKLMLAVDGRPQVIWSLQAPVN